MLGNNEDRFACGPENDQLEALTREVLESQIEVGGCGLRESEAKRQSQCERTADNSLGNGSCK